MKTGEGLMCMVILIMLMIAATASAWANDSSFCATRAVFDSRYVAKTGVLSSCQIGDCDNPATRDQWIPGSPFPHTYIRIVFNVFCDDYGENCVKTQEEIDAQADALNDAFFPYGFQFKHTTRFINDWEYADPVGGSFGDDAMKEEYAYFPDEFLNIFVPAKGFYGINISTYPWEDDALGSTGGIIMDPDFMYPTYLHILTHEVGHALGLYHTFEGVYNPNGPGFRPCDDPCREAAESRCGGEGVLNGDLVGDLCCDTRPHKKGGPNSPCQYTTDYDFCPEPDVPWDIYGTPDYTNYMTYRASCYDNFTDQQAGRMHCWYNDANYLNASWTWEVDEFMLSDNEGCSGASFRIDISLNNPLPTSYISLPVRYNGDVDLILDSVSQVGTRSEGMTVTLNTDIPGLYFKQYLIEGNATVEEMDAGSGVILKLYFTASGADYLQDETLIRVEEFGGIYPEVDHGEVQVDLIAYPGSYTVTYFPGDANGSGSVNVGDAVYIINYLDDEDPGPPPDPLESGDADCDGEITIDDASYIVDYVFSQGPAPECCDYSDPQKTAQHIMPNIFKLDQNAPNPFNQQTSISFSLSQSCNVTLDIYNILGQRVATIVDGRLEAGRHTVTWDASNVASGVYLYRMHTDNSVEIRKMMLLK